MHEYSVLPISYEYKAIVSGQRCTFALNSILYIYSAILLTNVAIAFMLMLTISLAQQLNNINHWNGSKKQNYDNDYACIQQNIHDNYSTWDNKPLSAITNSYMCL